MKSFRYAIAPKTFLRDLIDVGYEFFTNPKVKYEIADIVVVDLIDMKVMVEKMGRNVVSNVLELNENYLDIPMEKLSTIP